MSVNQGGQAAADCAFLLPQGAQAPTTDDIWVGLDGVLYNSRELAKQCELPPHDLCAGQSEVVRQCYKRWGASCFSRFRGSFACAILDLRGKRLLLARDHLGTRSLFFSIRRGFYFASTIQGTLEISGSSRRVDAGTLRKWLLDLPNDDPTQTFFEGIVRLPPATILELNLDTPLAPSVTEFWPLAEAREQRIKRDEAEERLRALFAESIELSTRDFPIVGVTLSGGLDSSFVLATLRKCKGDGYPIHSFTSISESRASQKEQSAARAVAELYKSASHFVGYDCQRIPDEVDDLLSNLWEPIASPVLFSLWELYRSANATGVGTLLNGHGSDSLFAGSPSHVITAAASCCRRGRPLKAYSMLANAAPGRGCLQLFKSLAGAGLPPALKDVLRPKSTPDWISCEWFENELPGTPAVGVLGQNGVAWNSNGNGKRPPALRAQLVRELRARSLPHTMRFEESMSEASSVSVCSPFLSPELVEFAFSLPEEFLIGSDGYTKSILRSASTDLLPGTIRECRDRLGFPVPAAEWLRSLTGWATEVLAEVRHLPFIDSCSVRKRWARFCQSGSGDWQQAMALWRVIFLTRWTDVLRAEF